MLYIPIFTIVRKITIYKMCAIVKFHLCIFTHRVIFIIVSMYRPFLLCFMILNVTQDFPLLDNKVF